MKEKAHYNPKSFTWIISLVVMIALCVGVIFGSKALYYQVNKKYIEGTQVPFTISSTKDIDASSLNTADYNVKAVKEAYDSSNNLVAYVVDLTTVGYNTAVPIEMSITVSADASLVCSIDIIHQDETEYLGVKIKEESFQSLFDGRYAPLVSSKDNQKGSPIDVLAGATISSQAVINGANAATEFVSDNFVATTEAE